MNFWVHLDWHTLITRLILSKTYLILTLWFFHLSFLDLFIFYIIFSISSNLQMFLFRWISWYNSWVLAFSLSPINSLCWFFVRLLFIDNNFLIIMCLFFTGLISLISKFLQFISIFFNFYVLISNLICLFSALAGNYVCLFAH